MRFVLNVLFFIPVVILASFVGEAGYDVGVFVGVTSAMLALHLALALASMAAHLVSGWACIWYATLVLQLVGAAILHANALWVCSTWVTC